MNFRKAREPEVQPIQTDMGRRWRWDHFATPDAARTWYEAKKAEGHQVFLRGRKVAWDQNQKTRHYLKPLQYPKTKIDHCPHCEERRTYTRVGTGKLDPRKAYRQRGIRDYHYVETPTAHTCPGLKAEREAGLRATARMNALFSRILRGIPT